MVAEPLNREYNKLQAHTVVCVGIVCVGIACSDQSREREGAFAITEARNPEDM